ncbi:MAG: SpoIIE family protein phosphatase, partial [Pseudomonadota bacterium]
ISSFVPIITEGQAIATVHMSMSTQVVRATGQSSGLSILGLAAILLSSVAGLSLLLLRRYVTVPMAKLQTSASIIAAGDLDAPIDLGRNDEIGALASGFDTMRQSLQRFVGALQAANEGLEKRVAERTSELVENQSKLTEANQLVFESIHYASRIQAAVLPPPDALNAVVAEHFLTWEPRDVVGGDFYWIKEVEHGAFIVVGDCTGHGVPGAFMTLIVCGMLDRIFAERTPPKPSAVLEQLNIGMKELLGQDGKKGGTDDGLEAGVCFIDRSRTEILFSGARFSLWQIEQGQSTEIKGEKAGLGHRRSPRSARFSDTIVPFQNDSRFYMATDGLIDQVGGPKNRSFGKRRLVQFLLSIYERPMTEQAGAMSAHLADFQGAQRRRDDVTMLGFRPGPSP